MGHFIAASKTIVSIYPVAPPPQERFIGETKAAGRTLFTIAPAPKGEYRLLVVPDMFYLERDWNVPDRQEGAFKSMMQAAEETSADLVQSWTNTLIGARESGGRPGIAIYDDDIPAAWPRVIKEVKDDKFQGFIDSLTRSQDQLFEYLFYDAQKLAQQGDWKQITSLHRTAAEWLNKEAAWVKPDAGDRLKDCPACFAKVDARAWMCPTCRTQIAERPDDLKFGKAAGR